MSESIRWIACGPAKDGCHEIAPEVAARFIELGGDDIQVWGTDYILDAQTTEALEYAVEALELESVSEAE